MPLKGHKSPVSSLSFDSSGSRLASGGRDTHVIVWDVVNECGLFRLKGHKGPVTRVRFMHDKNVLVSSSKDTLVKFWDLDIQHCFSTLTGHLTEIWDFALIKNDGYVLTGSSDAELRVFRLTFREDEEEGEGGDGAKGEKEPNLKKLRVLDEFREEDEGADEEDEDQISEDAKRLRIEKLGSLLRASTGKVAGLEVDETGRILACHGTDPAGQRKGGDGNAVECFQVCSEEEVAKRLQKKAKKERRKVAKKEGSAAEAVADAPAVEATIKEEFRRLDTVRAGGKVKAVRVSVVAKGARARITALTANNMLQQFTLSAEDKGNEVSKGVELEQAGHRSDVRTVAFSSDNTAVVSGSHEALKVWSRGAQSCSVTIPAGESKAVLKESTKNADVE